MSNTRLDGGTIGAMKQAFTDGKAESLANQLKLFACPTRLKIIKMLYVLEEVCVSDISEVLGITSPAVSQLLKRLRNAGVVASRRDSQTVYYRLRADYRVTSVILGLLDKQVIA